MQEEDLNRRIVLELGDAVRLLEERVPNPVPFQGQGNNLQEFGILREDDRLGSGIRLSEPHEVSHEMINLSGESWSVEFDALDLSKFGGVEFSVDC